jgi:hypothetical protein
LLDFMLADWRMLPTRVPDGSTHGTPTILLLAWNANVLRPCWIEITHLREPAVKVADDDVARMLS